MSSRWKNQITMKSPWVSTYPKKKTRTTIKETTRQVQWGWKRIYWPNFLTRRRSVDFNYRTENWSGADYLRHTLVGNHVRYVWCSNILIQSPKVLGSSFIDMNVKLYRSQAGFNVSVLIPLVIKHWQVLKISCPPVVFIIERGELRWNANFKWDTILPSSGGWTISLASIDKNCYWILSFADNHSMIQSVFLIAVSVSLVSGMLLFHVVRVYGCVWRSVIYSVLGLICKECN